MKPEIKTEMDVGIQAGKTLMLNNNSKAWANEALTDIKIYLA
jgi:hypothetical protein